MRWRLWVLIAAIAAGAGVLFFFPAIPQSEAYHNFADQRALLGIPHCLDVISNFAFLIGLYAFAKLLEAADRPVYSALRFVSGHTLKHLAAALSAYWIVRMLRLRRAIQQA